jgi:hypothetical protein
VQAVCGLRAALDVEADNWRLWVNLVLLLLQVHDEQLVVMMPAVLLMLPLQVGEVDLAVKTGRKALQVRDVACHIRC